MHGWSDAYGLRDFLISQQMNYPKPLYYSLMNLLGSHDVDRLRTALAADRNLRELSREDQLKYEFSEGALSRALQQERLCAAIQFAIPGEHLLRRRAGHVRCVRPVQPPALQGG